MVKPLTFKGDKKPKKRKRAAAAAAEPDADRDTAAAASRAGNDDDDHDHDHDAEPSRKLARRRGSPPSLDDAGPHDDSWVSADAVGDVLGPVMIVLPAEAPAALACDVSGKVFALAVENIVDGNPASAEPHDVRMVWVANRIAGTGHFRLRGHHGRYLACDKAGLLSATSEAISPLETWSVIATPDAPGTFQLQTQRDTFLTIQSGRGAPTSLSSSSPSSSSAAAAGEKTRAGKAGVEVRGDADAIGFGTTLRIRMQACFKPHVKSARDKGAQAKISRRELEEAAGRRLTEEEVKKLKRAKREGDFHERMLEIKVKSKHDKFG